MEKICDNIYIDNNKLLLVKFDTDGETLFTKNDISFINFVNLQIESFPDYNYVEKIMSIMPSTATKAELILTNNCNMGCIYCYSTACRNTNTLNFDQASKIIDRLITNSILKNIKIGREKKIYLSFHGGGEPAFEFNLLKDIVKYAKDRARETNTKLFLEITTNLSQDDKNIIDFYLKNDFFIHISMDGIESVQNYQRPYSDGSNSFETVVNNIEYLSKHGAMFSIRLTVTDYSLTYAVDSVKFLRKTFPNVKFIKLAPLQIIDENHNNLVKPPSLESYLNILNEIDSLPWNDDSKYISIFGEVDTLINSGMCASVRFEQLIVSPEGMITTCHEEPLSDRFRYGKISEEGVLEIDNEKVKRLKKESWENITRSRCSNCKIRYLCMGGCKHRMLSRHRDMFCAIEKFMFTNHIKRVFCNTNKDEYDIIYKRINYDKKGVMEIVSLGGYK